MREYSLVYCCKLLCKHTVSLHTHQFHGDVEVPNHARGTAGVALGQRAAEEKRKVHSHTPQEVEVDRPAVRHVESCGYEVHNKDDTLTHSSAFVVERVLARAMRTSRAGANSGQVPVGIREFVVRVSKGRSEVWERAREELVYNRPSKSGS